MIGVHTFFLGLGLFFVGLMMTGERMRSLVGGVFQRVAIRVASPAFGAMVGTGFGALMQSATAVTFILVSMVRSGLITAVVALPILLWANVGITALSFVATLDIHVVVAWIVGIAGIALGLLKIRALTSWAGLVFGVGLVLLGLQTMGEGAAPLKGAPWFQHVLEMTTSSPGLAFFVGTFAAAILQSNVGTALLVFTLAEAGALSLETSALIIYGSNLGAIFLRIFLSLGMDRPSFRLVRFQDFFCLWSGAVMVALYALEAMGVPLVLSLVRHVTVTVDFQIAGIFLLSNLVPVLLLYPWRKRALNLLTRLWPGELPEDFSRPKFLNNTALDHPGTAILLAQKELARLLGNISARCDEPERAHDVEEFLTSTEFLHLGQAIEKFFADLISRNDLNRGLARVVQLQRAELSIIRYLADSVGQFSLSATEITAVPSLAEPAAKMAERLNLLLKMAVDAATNLAAGTVIALHEESLKRNPINLALREALHSPATAADSDHAPSAEAVRGNFSTTLWVLHRYAKLLERDTVELLKT